MRTENLHRIMERIRSRVCFSIPFFCLKTRYCSYRCCWNEWPGAWWLRISEPAGHRSAGGRVAGSLWRPRAEPLPGFSGFRKAPLSWWPLADKARRASAPVPPPVTPTLALLPASLRPPVMTWGPWGPRAIFTSSHLQSRLATRGDALTGEVWPSGRLGSARHARPLSLFLHPSQ